MASAARHVPGEMREASCRDRVLVEHRGDFLPSVDPAQHDLPTHHEAEEQGHTAKDVEPSPRSTDEGFNIRDWVIIKDDPTPCRRCSGRGHRFVNQTRPDETCPDCDGTGMIYVPRNQGGSLTD